MDAHGVRGAHVGDLVDDVEVFGRLELDLDRQAAGPLDRLPALPDVQRTAVGPAGAAGRQRDVHGAVEVAGRDGHLGQHGRCLLGDRAPGLEGDADAAVFWTTDLLEAADELVPLIRNRRPQVLVTYNQFGGYGHPDHIQAHRVAMYGVQLAGVPRTGPIWASRGR